MAKAMTPCSSIDYLARLVAFPTVSRDSNLDLIDFVRQRARRHRRRSCRLIASEDGRKANLFATIGPDGPAGHRAFGPYRRGARARARHWTSDPFTLRNADGRLYGRGSADMKGFIACCLTMLAHGGASASSPSPCTSRSRYDEEVGCLGVRRLIDMMKGLPVRPRFCIVGEPTSLQVVTAHKGKVGMRVTCTGAGGAFQHRTQRPSTPCIWPAISSRRSAPSRRKSPRPAPKTATMSFPIRRCMSANIAGGEVINIVPNRCRFEYEIRYIPEDDPEGIVARIREGGGADRERRTASFPTAPTSSSRRPPPIPP